MWRSRRLITLDGVLALAISTSTPAVTAGVAEVDSRSGTRLLGERVTVDAHKHSELLAPSIAAVLAEAGRVPGDLAAVVCDTGPGPFTGLRVGIVTAAALADAVGIPAYAVCGLDAIASNAQSSSEEHPLLVATDARRKEIYWAVYRHGRRQADPDVARPAQVAQQLAGVTRAVGDGAQLYADVLGLPASGPRYPSARHLVDAARDRIVAQAPGETLQPRYLRVPDAVENLARKTVSQP